MRVALVGAADFNAEHFKAQHFDYCIAVDAGWKACSQAGVAVDIAIGDFDSLGFVPEDVHILQYHSEKNESDMELACLHAQEQGANEIYLYGAFSNRLDHSLANIQLMLGFAQQGIKMFGVGTDFALAMLANGENVSSEAMNNLSFDAFDTALLQGEYAPYISTLAIAGSAQGLTIQGLAYEVSNFTLSEHVSRGLSNQFVGSAVKISLQRGNILVIFPLDALAYARY